MKKLATVLFSVALLASVSAQNKVSETAKSRANMNMKFVNTEVLNYQNEVKTAAPTQVDTIFTQGFYNECFDDGAYWGVWRAYPPESKNMNEIQASQSPLGNNDWHIRSNAHFHTTIVDGFDTYNSLAGIKTKDRVVVAAFVNLGRSGTGIDPEINNAPMPFHVQAREVREEEHLDDLLSQTPRTVAFRVAGKRIASSDTIQVPVTGFRDVGGGRQGLIGKWFGLPFTGENIFRAGEDFAIELGFPMLPKSKDTLWNCYTTMLSNGCYGYDPDGTSWTAYSTYFWDDNVVPFTKKVKEEFGAFPQGNPQLNEEEQYVTFPFGNFWSDQEGKLLTNLAVKVAIRDIGTGVESLNPLNDQASVYPIPAKRDVTVNSLAEIRDIQIFNLAGQIVQEYKAVNDLVFSFNVENFKSGMYIAKINTVQGLVTKKITVQ